MDEEDNPQVSAQHMGETLEHAAQPRTASRRRAAEDATTAAAHAPPSKRPAPLQRTTAPCDQQRQQQQQTVSERLFRRVQDALLADPRG